MGINGFMGKTLLTAVALTTVSSATIAYAAYWTVSTETVSAHGNWSSYGSGNVKQSNSNYASFNGDVQPASYGYSAHLINSNAAGRSNTVNLLKDVTQHADGNTGARGYAYYGDIRSRSYEPNSSTVKFHFSSDYQ